MVVKKQLKWFGLSIGLANALTFSHYVFAELNVNQIYLIKPVHSDKCLEVANGQMDDGINIQQWTCNNKSHQQWQFIKSSAGYYSIIAVHSGKMLDVSGAKVDNGTNIHQWEKNNTVAQQFLIEKTTSDTYKIINPHSGKALDIAEWQQSNGGNLQQWDFHGGDNQLFKFIPAVKLPTPPKPDNNNITPLFSSATKLEPPLSYTTDLAAITKVGGRVRDRHAREKQFKAYQHYLANYFENRTFGLEIHDTTVQGGNRISVKMITEYPHDKPNFRAFFRGKNTVAEYYTNTTFNQFAERQYEKSITYNPIEKRPIQKGDLIEFEIGVFLRQPVPGRHNYYSRAYLYRAGEPGILAWQTKNPQGGEAIPLEKSALLGGDTTLSVNYSGETSRYLMQMAQNIAPNHSQRFVTGRRLHHTNFIDGRHSEPGNPVFSEHQDKVGPLYNQPSCVSCHVLNGKGVPQQSSQDKLERLVVKLGELDQQGNVIPHQQWGSQLQTKATVGNPEGQLELSRYERINGQFADGTGYTLYKPIYQFQQLTHKQAPLYSVRSAPALVGMGLLEAISEETVMTYADPDDSNNDGISGRASIITDPKDNSINRLGRLGWKASTIDVQHQVAAALNEDMGVTSALFPDASANQELSKKSLATLVDYIRLLGVPPRRQLMNKTVSKGEQLFNQVGCASCHRAEVKTSQYHPYPELRNQTIRPYTDLLLHDMGALLADTLPTPQASASEWRTPPLWGIGLVEATTTKPRYLHDGRARSLLEAILWHGGEAKQVVAEFKQLSQQERDAIVAFLKSL